MTEVTVENDSIHVLVVDDRLDGEDGEAGGMVIMHPTIQTDSKTDLQ